MSSAFCHYLCLFLTFWCCALHAVDLYRPRYPYYPTPSMSAPTHPCQSAPIFATLAALYFIAKARAHWCTPIETLHDLIIACWPLVFLFLNCTICSFRHSVCQIPCSVSLHCTVHNLSSIPWQAFNTYRNVSVSRDWWWQPEVDIFQITVCILKRKAIWLTYISDGP